jgi:uncharacterized repeat protein (TIGR04076 family)
MGSKMKRREFCQTVPAAVVGIMACPYVLRSAGIGKEENVEKKVKHIEIKVASVKGTCGAGCKVGDIARVTEQGVEGKICIHALYSMLPAVFAMMYEARFPWLSDPDVKTHACPDAANPVVFEIRRVREA